MHFYTLIPPSKKSNLLTLAESSNTGQLLALEKLQASATAGRDVAELVLNAILGSNGSGITTTNDNNLALLSSLNSGVKGGLGAVGELVELEDTSGAVPEDGLGLINGLLVELDRLLAAVETHPAVRNTIGIGGLASVGILVELIGGDVVDGENNLDVVLLGLFDQITDSLGAGLIEEGGANGHFVESLLEGESHATADDEGVDLLKEVVDQLDLVGDLGTAEDGEEGALGGLEGLGEVVELLLHEETGGLLGEVDSDHGGVSAVSSAESVVWETRVSCQNFQKTRKDILTDVDVTELGETLAELLNLGLVGLDLVALGIGALALFFDVETEVLEENNLAVVGLVDDLLNLGADAVGGEGDALAELLLKLGNDGLEGVFLVYLTVGSAEVRHEDDGLGAMVNGVLDGRHSADDALGVGNLLVGVKGHVKVDLHSS